MFRPLGRHWRTEYRVDIAIEENRIIITHQGRRIGVEIKSGVYIDTKHLYQIIRLLFDVDVLIFARIPMEQVDVIYQQDMLEGISQDITRITDKLKKLSIKKNLLLKAIVVKAAQSIVNLLSPLNFLIRRNLIFQIFLNSLNT